MFDISWSELLILGIVSLIFVGPKELPVFLRTLGRYAGAVRRQANEFKAQFDTAIREAQLEEMQASINAEVMQVKTSFDEVKKLTKIEHLSAQTPAALEATPGVSDVAMPPMPAPPRAEP